MGFEVICMWRVNDLEMGCVNSCEKGCLSNFNCDNWYKDVVLFRYVNVILGICNFCVKVL